MPFSKVVADPQTLEVMRAAFRMVCDALALKCEAQDPLTDLIIDRIVEAGQVGGLDAGSLRDHVLVALERTWADSPITAPRGGGSSPGCSGSSP
jgi:hypothetical protein